MDNNSVINIAFCTDKNYLEYVAIAIKSVQLNNLSHLLQFHVFLYDVPEIELQKFLQLDAPIKTHIIPTDELMKYQNDHQLKHLNRSMYLRLLVPRLLQKEIEKFIYLDADILCFHDLSSIHEIDIDSVVCAVITDSLNPESISKNTERLKLKNHAYFNSGFMYINTNNWCNADIENQVNNVLALQKPKNLKYPDQDALNIVLEGKVQYIETKWNYLFTWMNEHEKERFFYDKQVLPYLVHFTGARKPWYQEHIGLAQNLYLFYKHFTPYANEPLKSYLPRMRVNDYRIYAKQYLKKGNIFKGFYFYIQYFLKKLIPHKVKKD